MKNIRINKTLKLKNKSIEIRYEGIPLTEDIDTSKQEKLLEIFLLKHCRNDMVKNVSFLRTILKDYQEKLLVIHYQDELGTELVKYDNSNLFLFEKKKYDNGEEQYKIKYDSSQGIKLEYNDDMLSDFKDYQNVKLVSSEMDKILNHIYHLKHTQAIKLSNDSKVLIEIYKLFYNENPNFSEENINIKVQTMMSILVAFDISLGDDYSFTKLPRVRLPLSLNLSELVNNLFPFGEISFVDEPIKLADYPKKVIKIVGENIKEAIKKENNQLEALIMISKILYATRYQLSSCSKVNEISEFTNYTPNEVKSSIRLIKSIKKKIEY